MKQSAVEFLLEKYKSQNTLLFSDDFEQAKEMEKEQIIDAHNNGKNILPPNESGQQYYEEFKSQMYVDATPNDIDRGPK